MVSRKSRLARAKRKKQSKWDFVSLLGSGVEASAKMSAVGKVPALLPALGAGFG